MEFEEQAESRKMGRMPAVDLAVALVSVPLLVCLGLLLGSNLRGDWTRDEDARWNVLALGIAILLVGLLDCCYATHRMGLCIWENTNRRDPRLEGPVSTSSSQVNLVPEGGVSPPSYDSVVRGDAPPPYCLVGIRDDVPTIIGDLGTERTGTTPPQHPVG